MRKRREVIGTNHTRTLKPVLLRQLPNKNELLDVIIIDLSIF